MSEADLITNNTFVDFMFQLWFATGRNGKFSEYISKEIRKIVAETSGSVIADSDRHERTTAA
jgi:hypothetical protein